MQDETGCRLRKALASFDDILLAVVFGSFANETAGSQSDIDVAVLAAEPLDARRKMELIESIALAFDRPVDLVDLRRTGQPLLNQVIQTGQVVLGSRWQWGDLVYRNIMENEDFVPYQQRILEGRRKAWIDS